MKTIVVEDEPIMLKSFKRISEGIDGLDIVAEFEFPEKALEYAKDNYVELALLDISMPGMTGLELARELRTINPKILIVFITAYDEYIKESHEIGADYYIIKPYKRNVLEQMMEKMTMLSARLQKEVYIRTFGRFMVFKDGKPVKLEGKAKEILAIIVTKRGKEISNEEIYSMIWENRPYGNVEMKVYYNALKRLRNSLEAAGITYILQSTTRGQMVNVDKFDCDYYSWLDRSTGARDRFEGEFMSEYSWGEAILGDLIFNTMDPHMQ